MRLYVILCSMFCLYACDKIHKKHLTKPITINDTKDFSEPIFEQIPIENTEEIKENEVLYNEKFYTKISCHITSGMALNDAIINLAKESNISVCLANGINEKISLSAQNKPFIDIIEDICNLCDLRYKIINDSISIEKDQPYLEVYDIQFLNLSRESKCKIASTNDVFASADSITHDNRSKKTQNVLDNGSSSSVKAKGKNDFWAELENSIKAILNDTENSSVSIHRQGGLVSIIANSKKHKVIKDYIKLLKKTTETQVLIEAKILEVKLKDEYRSGINWYTSGTSKIILDAKSADDISNSSQLPMFSLGYSSTNFSSILKYIERFGAIKTLSNPRITVMNNQSAVLKVARNEIVSKPAIYRNFSTYRDTRSSDSFYTDIQTIPIGLIFTVQPAIDFSNKTITLTLRPTISRVVDFKKIPTYTYIGNGGSTSAMNAHQNTIDIPVVEVRELDSVLNVKSGQVIVLGGLMQEKSISEISGVPGTKKYKVIKDIFNSSAEDSEISELIIFLRARIIDKKSKNVIHPKDINYSKKYTNDTRPII